MPAHSNDTSETTKSVAGQSAKDKPVSGGKQLHPFQAVMSGSAHVKQLQTLQLLIDQRPRTVQKQEEEQPGEMATSTVQARFVPDSQSAQQPVVQRVGIAYPADKYATMIGICRANIDGRREEVVAKMHKVLYDDGWNLTSAQVDELHALLVQAGSNEDTYMSTYVGVNYHDQEQLDKVNELLTEREHHLKGGQRAIVENFLRRNGLNQDSQVDAYVDSLYENMNGVNGNARVKVSAMMQSVNARITAGGLPALPIVYANGLENGNSANFDYRTWRIQIDEALLNNFNAAMANTLYHEARHSEQWFKMILLQQIPADKTDATITAEMGVPAATVALARAKQATIDVFFPPEQRMPVFEYYESVYGAQRAARRAVILGLGVVNPANYKKYKALPEEVDAWDTGGRVEKSIDKKIVALSKQINAGQDLTVVRNLCSKFNYYVNLSAKKAEYVEGIKTFLDRLVDNAGRLRARERASGADARPDILRIGVKHNYLAQACGLPRVSADDLLGADRSFQLEDWAEIGIAASNIVQ